MNKIIKSTLYILCTGKVSVFVGCVPGARHKQKEQQCYFVIPLKRSSWDRFIQFSSFLTGIL